MTPLNLPAQIVYLENYLANSASMCRKAEWLLSDFDASVWEYDFGNKTRRTFDWDVILEDGESLTSPKHKELLEGLKIFLIASTKNANDMFSETNSSTKRHLSFIQAGHIIDHLLLNTNQYQLASYGLEGLGRNELIHLLKKTGESNDVDEILDWEPSVGSLIKEMFGCISHESLERVLIKYPAMRVVTPKQEDENKLGISASEIPNARAALYISGFYHHTNNQWQIKAHQLTKIVYANTLFAKNGNRHLILTLTCDNKDFFERREYPAVRVSTCSLEDTSSHRFFAYQSALYRFGYLHEVGVPAPSAESISAVMSHEAELGERGRFRTLPSAIALESMRNAIEFHLKHGTHLINSFCKLALHCVQTGNTPRSCQGTTLAKILRKETVALGVTKATLMSNSAKRIKEEYFSEFRANSSLLELVRVYIGSVQLVVGALMARRSGEMIDLEAANCLDSTEQWLLFLNRKSTKRTFGIRHMQARPIEPIAVAMIKNLVRMQKILKRIGYIKDMTSLFAVPCPRGNRGIKKCTKENFSRSLDYFCDYFETSTNKAGERYYIRQHQLRRFFAMLFFHSCSFGGLETLQWMLAHTNRRHVWNYITESVPGTELMSSKSQHVAEQLHHGGIESYQNLRSFLKARHGADDFLLWDINDLEDEITHLQKEGWVEIEPEFFEEDDVEQMRILVKIVESAA